MIEFKELEFNKQSIEKFAILTSSIWHEYWTCILSNEQIDYMVEKFQSAKAITEQIKNENYIYFYILYNNETAGYIGVSKKSEYLFLSKLYMKKNFRHKGIGTQAFEFIKGFGRKNNYKTIQLTVNKNNKNTIDAYIKWNFKIIDSVVTDIGNGFVMDDYIMEYDL